jgi:hypothetical protein
MTEHPEDDLAAYAERQAAEFYAENPGRDPAVDSLAITLYGDLCAEFSRRSLSGRAEAMRKVLPGTVAGMTQVVIDNPGQFALVMAGGMVAARAAFNLVKPKTPLECLALAVVLQVGLPMLAMKSVERGWLKFRTRDADGNLVPLVTGRQDA